MRSFLTVLVWSVWASVVSAQLLPPTGAFEWAVAAGSGDWAVLGNWLGGAVPPPDADVVFPSTPSGLTPVNPYDEELVVRQDDADLGVNSLWFDTGREYVLSGKGSLVLGAAMAADGGRLITVRDSSLGAWQSEHRIDLDLQLKLPKEDWSGLIENYSAGGLGLGGTITLGKHGLRVGGPGTVHFSGQLVGSGSLTLEWRHLVLSRDNRLWTGATVVRDGFLVVTANRALGAGTAAVKINGAGSGASLAFRPRLLGTGVNYTAAKAVELSGTGYLRPWGAQAPSDPSSPLKLAPVGAIYNDGGDNRFAGDIQLLGDTWLGSRVGTLLLSGRISEAAKGYSVTKVGHGVVALGSAANSWSGRTVLREGVLRLDVAGALPGTSALRFEGGILGLTAGDFAADLGSGAGQVAWKPGLDGGFAAFGGPRSVTLNGGAVLAWGQLNFVEVRQQLLLGSAYSDAPIDFKNGLNLALGHRIALIQVARGTTATSYAILSGKLTGTGGRLVKTGDGTLWLQNPGNDYSGPTAIAGGVVRGYIPDTSNLLLNNGGVVGLEGDFMREVGTDPNHVWWNSGDGGFAAYGGTRTVRLNGDALTPIAIGSLQFVKQTASLIFGAPDSDGTVRFDNRIQFASGTTNTMRVIGGTASPAQADVEFAQVFQSAGNNNNGRLSSLIFAGSGRADLLLRHAEASFKTMLLGARGVDLRLRGRAQFPDVGLIEASWGGSVTFDNTQGYVADRIGSDKEIRLTAGAFRYWGGGGALSQHASQRLTLLAGANRLEILHNSTALHSISRLEFDSLTCSANGGTTIDFSTSATTAGDSLHPHQSTTQIRFVQDLPGKSQSILPYGTVNATTWARVLPHPQQGATHHYIVGMPESAYNTTGGADTDGWGTAVDASPSSYRTMLTSQSLNSLRLTSGLQFDLNGHTLTLAAGVLATGDTGTRIHGKTDSMLYAQSQSTDPLYIHVYNTAAVGLEIDAELRSPQGLVKAGPGTLLLSGATSNVITRNSYVHDGALALRKTGGAVAIAGRITVGDRSGRDVLRLEHSEQIANNARVILRGGAPNPTHGLMAEGILQFRHVNAAGVADGLGLRETFRQLDVIGRGVIDFAGGTVAHANFLILDELRVAADSRLFIRNWYEHEDYLLVRKSSRALNASLPHIDFEGYGPAILRDWNSEFFHVTPMPEPAAYGAALGALGLGLLLWRKHRRRSRAHCGLSGEPPRTIRAGKIKQPAAALARRDAAPKAL